MRAALSNRCIADHWPIEATRCHGTARSKSDLDDCVPLLTLAQREAAANAVAAFIPNRDADPVPEQ